MEEPILVVGKASGMIEAEILRGFLQSMGIDVWLSREAASTAYGLGVGPMAEVELLVRSDQASAARQALAEYQSGRLAAEG